METSKLYMSKFFEKHLCKHIIGIGHRVGCIKIPSNAKDVEFAISRLKGRPAKAKKALDIQTQSTTEYEAEEEIIEPRHSKQRRIEILRCFIANRIQLIKHFAIEAF